MKKRKDRGPDPETPAPQPALYEAVFDRAFEATDRRLPELLREVDEAAALLAELLGTPEAERRRLVETGVRFQSLQLCGLLEMRSREAWFEDPARAVALAELAVAAATRLDEAHYGVQRAEDARASAWAYLGNACRIAADHRRAEQALATAEEHLRRGGGDAYTEALLLGFEASLRGAQRQFDEAARLLDDAIATYREARDRQQEGKALVKKGMILGYAGRHDEAIRLIRRGLARLDIVQEPRLLVAARHNLTWFLNESGRHQEAEASVEESRRLYLDLGERTNLVRLRWLEGNIARELGREEAAEAALQEARDAFLESGIGIDAALVSLDLAAIYFRRKDTGALKRLAAEIEPVFAAGDLQQEALAALLLFRQAAEAEEVTLDLLDQVATGLQPARGNLERRFRAGS